jgi:hypothetical protein
MGAHVLYFVTKYHILIEAGYNNNKRKFPLTPTQIRDWNFQVERIFLEILKRKTGQIIANGISSSGYPIVVTPLRLGPRICNAETRGPATMQRGDIYVQVSFTPDASCHLDPKTKNFKPGGTLEETLFHELVHAFRIVTDTASDREGPFANPFVPKSLQYPEFDVEEDFFAVLITNIFSSETGRPLRKDHGPPEALPSQLSTNKGFLAIEPYARLVRQFCTDHPSVSQELRDVPSAFNPIKEVLVGQGFQHLLNDR